MQHGKWLSSACWSVSANWCRPSIVKAGDQAPWKDISSRPEQTIRSRRKQLVLVITGSLLCRMEAHICWPKLWCRFAGWQWPGSWVFWRCCWGFFGLQTVMPCCKSVWTQLCCQGIPVRNQEWLWDCKGEIQGFQENSFQWQRGIQLGILRNLNPAQSKDKAGCVKGAQKASCWQCQTALYLL